MDYIEALENALGIKALKYFCLYSREMFLLLADTSALEFGPDLSRIHRSRRVLAVCEMVPRVLWV